MGGLPVDAEFFSLLASESSIRSVVAHIARAGVDKLFQFSAPEARDQLQRIGDRLEAELRACLVRAGRAGQPEALVRALHVAGDLAQARRLLGAMVEPAEGSEPASKRKCSDMTAAEHSLLRFGEALRAHPDV